MAEERTLGLARAPLSESGDSSKEELQLRMEEARESISQTVTEIKETVAHQYETVKDALDWREQFKKHPIAFSLGAAGVGFCVGYSLAAAVDRDDSGQGYSSSDRYSYDRQANARFNEVSGPATPLHANLQQTGQPEGTNDTNDGPGLIERVKDSRAYDRLQHEVESFGDRLIDELSTTAQTVILPALVGKVREWLGADVSTQRAAELQSTSPGSSNPPAASSYQPKLERNPS